MALSVAPLPVCRAADLALQAEQERWLIRSLWSYAAVGIIGGAPKVGKSWLGLDMALSVASATPCLGHFEVAAPGPSLVFLAEDALPAVRARIGALCAHRGLAIEQPALFVITAPTLRLDLEKDQRRLHATLADLRPRLLLLDPLVRLHRLDENSAADISRLLGFLRELQRAYDLAVVLVHHASKRQRAQPGQALRGSSDLHAFGDSNAYLARHQDHLVLSLEHRAAPAPPPVGLELVSLGDGSATHLALRGDHREADASLQERVVALLRHSTVPLTRTALRARLKVNNQRLGEALTQLDKRGTIVRTPEGWLAPEQSPPRQAPASATPAHERQCRLPL
jgi:hypothetical protein